LSFLPRISRISRISRFLSVAFEVEKKAQIDVTRKEAVGHSLKADMKTPDEQVARLSLPGFNTPLGPRRLSEQRGGGTGGVVETRFTGFLLVPLQPMPRHKQSQLF
jgi:hypothetical protein